ncbi:MAG TPA: methyltransferase domain-containing protein [Nostocaceae cyanobacterium]|nr:methyltransferase domain-containing protein [Nostocaceae cyanobacterium]
MSNYKIQSNWDGSLYNDKHAFVWQHGEDLLRLLNPKLGEYILDLGCGTGQLTEKIAIAGAEILGIDAAPSMIETAKANYPQLRFQVGDARNFQVDKPCDAIFSNATLHWIKEADAVIACISQALKPGGRFVAEFGYRRNIDAIAQALETSLAKIGIPEPQTRNPWYFPSLGEYVSKLEQQGFDVTYANTFPRPTFLTDGEAGLRNWIRMFANSFLIDLSAQQQAEVISLVEAELKPKLYHQGTWIADYWRIRIFAVKL